MEQKQREKEFLARVFSNNQYETYTEQILETTFDRED